MDREIETKYEVLAVILVLLLIGDDLGRNFVDGSNAECVLGGDRGDRARAVDTQGQERLQIGLDPRARAGVRSGDGHGPRLAHGPESNPPATIGA